jgi:hypothetical protein
MTNNIKSKINAFLCIIGLFVIIIFSDCATKRQNDFFQYNFSLKNTLSIFLLNNEKNYYFCIPVQYIGDYQIQNFEFASGSIQIGNYDILLKRDGINISVYLNEAADELGNSNGEFRLIHLEENGKILVSKMSEPLSIKDEPNLKFNHYYIFIEKFINDDEVKYIINEYKNGNVNSHFSIWYDIIIDNEEQMGNGIIDDFELYDGTAMDPVWFPSNLDFFKARYLQE